MRARLLLALGLAGTLVCCRNSRTTVPGFDQPADPTALRSINHPAAGPWVEVPRTRTVAVTASPLATISSGAAVVAIWSHPTRRTSPLSARELRRAERELLPAARRLGPTLALIRAAVIRLAGRAAVELDALEHVGGQFRHVRSVQVFIDGAEVVLDAYAPAASFHAVDHAVFSPLKRTLGLTAPIA